MLNSIIFPAILLPSISSFTTLFKLSSKYHKSFENHEKITKPIYNLPWNKLKSDKICNSKFCWCNVPKEWQIEDDNLKNDEYFYKIHLTKFKIDSVDAENLNCNKILFECAPFHGFNGTVHRISRGYPRFLPYSKKKNFRYHDTRYNFKTYLGSDVKKFFL